VIPVAHAYDEYARKVAKQFYDAGFYAEADTGSDTLKKKILEAQVAQWNYILGSLPCPSRKGLTNGAKLSDNKS
jgi:threonyl-tRNA synthetase